MNAARQMWQEIAPLFGLADLVPDPDGLIRLRLGGDGLLQLEGVGDGLLMGMARPCGAQTAPLLALAACDARRTPLPVRAGLRVAGHGCGTDLLVLVLRFSAAQCSLPAVARGLDLLLDLHGRIATGGGA